MGSADREYYARRARQERERERTAGESSATIAHRTMAEEYERRVRAL